MLEISHMTKITVVMIKCCYS